MVSSYIHHIVKIRGGVTRRDDDERTNDKQWKIGLLSLWAVGRLSFAIRTRPLTNLMFGEFSKKLV